MRISAVAFSAIFMTAAALGAQDLHYGLQVGINSPQGDVKSNLHLTTGYSLGADLLVDLGEGNAIVPRISYSEFSGNSFVDGAASTISLPGPSFTTYLINGKGRFSSVSLTADYNYFVNGHTNDALYFSIGAGLAHNSYTLDLTTDPHVSLPISRYTNTKNAMIFDAGIGYMFYAHIGVQAKYELTKYGDSDHSINAPWVNLELVMRF